MAESGNVGMSSKIVIPYYNPAKTDISAKAWLGYVEMARDSAGISATSGEPNWTEKQTVTKKTIITSIFFSKMSGKL